MVFFWPGYQTLNQHSVPHTKPSLNYHRSDWYHICSLLLLFFCASSAKTTSPFTPNTIKVINTRCFMRYTSVRWVRWTQSIHFVFPYSEKEIPFLFSFRQHWLRAARLCAPPMPSILSLLHCCRYSMLLLSTLKTIWKMGQKLFAGHPIPLLNTTNELAFGFNEWFMTKINKSDFTIFFLSFSLHVRCSHIPIRRRCSLRVRFLKSWIRNRHYQRSRIRKNVEIWIGTRLMLKFRTAVVVNTEHKKALSAH